MKRIYKSLAALFSLLLIMSCFWACKQTVDMPPEETAPSEETTPPTETTEPTQPKEYTITYVLNDGTNNAANPASYTVESETITLKEPTKDGYTFAGWYETESFEGNPTAEIAKGTTGNKTFYAKWNIITYTITYELNGGTGGIGNPIAYTAESETITLEEPTKNGYTFAGWYATADCTGTATTEIRKGSTGDKTFYAKWKTNLTPSITITNTPDITVTHSTENGVVTFTAGTGYTYKWYVDKTAQAETKATFTFDTTTQTKGVHEILLVAKKGGTVYSAQFNVDVK